MSPGGDRELARWAVGWTGELLAGREVPRRQRESPGRVRGNSLGPGQKLLIDLKAIRSH